MRERAGIDAESRLERSLEQSEARLVASGAVVLRKAFSRTRGSLLSPHRRQLFEMSQRTNPIRSRMALATVDALVPCIDKDLPTLPLVIESIRSGTDNPLARIMVVVPRDLIPRVVAELDDQCEVMAEEDVIDEATRALIESIVPASRSGWVTQQLVKFQGVARSPQDGVLVVDADTVLLRPRTWLAGSQQLLVPVHEFHPPYEEHYQRVFGRAGRWATVSFVAHHQLMRPSIVKAMFGVTESARAQKLGQWIRAADFSEPSALSEYHTYGRWIETNASGDYVLGRWGNARVPRQRFEALVGPGAGSPQDAIARLRAELPTRLSLSMHSYLPPAAETTGFELG